VRKQINQFGATYCVHGTFKNDINDIFCFVNASLFRLLHHVTTSKQNSTLIKVGAAGTVGLRKNELTLLHHPRSAFNILKTLLRYENKEYIRESKCCRSLHYHSMRRQFKITKPNYSNPKIQSSFIVVHWIHHIQCENTGSPPPHHCPVWVVAFRCAGRY